MGIAFNGIVIDDNKHVAYDGKKVAGIAYSGKIVYRAPTESGEVLPTGIDVTPASALLAVGGKRQFSAVITPANATNKTITWESANTSVVIVSQDGLVTATGKGNTAVYAITVNGLEDYAVIVVF